MSARHRESPHVGEDLYGRTRTCEKMEPSILRTFERERNTQNKGLLHSFLSLLFTPKTESAGRKKRSRLLIPRGCLAQKDRRVLAGSLRLGGFGFRGRKGDENKLRGDSAK